MRPQVSIVIVIALAACDPVGPLPGGALDGFPTMPPGEWTIMDDVEEIQIETNPEDPYSVNVWVIGLGSRLYIAAGNGGDTRWGRNLLRDPNIKVRLRDNVYELVAREVDDTDELSAVRLAYIDKYSMAPDDPQFDDARLFRLDRRL